MPKHLRPEARAGAWVDLDEVQQRAFKDIVRMIGEAIVDLQSHTLKNDSARDPTAWVSRNRSSRTAFLSGGRGTGKTTLLLSIIEATVNSGPETPDPKDADFSRYLSLMRQCVVWLEPIDMEPMPP